MPAELKARVDAACKGNRNGWIREAIEAKLGDAPVPPPKPAATRDSTEERIRAEITRLQGGDPIPGRNYRQLAKQNLGL